MPADRVPAAAKIARRVLGARQFAPPTMIGSSVPPAQIGNSPPPAQARAVPPPQATLNDIVFTNSDILLFAKTWTLLLDKYTIEDHHQVNS